MNQLLDNARMSLKMALLTGFGLLISVAVGAQAFGLLSSIEESSKQLSALDAATSQVDAGAAGEAIAEVTAVIGRIDEIQATIAAAVEEQTATIDEISRSVGEAATGATAIAANVTIVADGTSAAASEALGTARSLAANAADLRALVSVFTVDVPALAPVPTPASQPMIVRELVTPV